MSGTDVDSFRRALGERIATVTTRYRTKAEAAAAFGCSDDQLSRWITGTAKVPAEALFRVSAVSETDLAWLATGRAEVVPISQRIQEPVLREVLTALAEVIADDGVIFAPEAFADLVLALHDDVVERQGRDDATAAPAHRMASMKNIIALAKRGR